MLEGVVPLETFPRVEWHKGELADVPSFIVLKTQICNTRPLLCVKTHSPQRQRHPIELFGFLCLGVRTPLVRSKSDISFWAINWNSTALEYQFSKARRNEQEFRRDRFEARNVKFCCFSLLPHIIGFAH